MTMNVFAELAELDPAREPDARPDWDTLAPALLSTLDERTLAMQTREPKTQPTEPGIRHRGWLVAAAAFALILLVGVVVILVNRATDAPPANPQPQPTTTQAQDEPAPEASTTTVPVTTTEAAPSTTVTSTTTVPAEDFFPGVADLTIGTIDPGPVAVRGVPIPFMFDAPDIGTDYAQPLWVIEPGMPGPGIVPGDAVFDPSVVIGTLIFPMTRADDDFDEVVADLTEEIPVAAATETTVGGQRAIQLDLEAFEGFYPLDSLGTDGSGQPNFGIDGDMFVNRFYIVDATDGTLIVWFEIAPDQLETLLPYWEQIVDTIEFAG